MNHLLKPSSGALLGLLVASLSVAPPAAAAGHRAPLVRSLSNPPSVLPAKLNLRMKGSAKTVAVYVSPQSHLGAGALLLARGARVSRARVTVRTRRLKPGAYFVIVCPSARVRRGCAAARRPSLVLPKRLPAPVDGAPSLEPGRASTATIGKAGGTLTATAADGTRFRLDVARGSVPDGTQITMSPVSALSGARGIGRLLGAVQLSPEGLILVHGANLTITPAVKVPLNEQRGVGYDGSGDDIHRVPLGLSRQIQIPLAHFSGAGVVAQPSGQPSPTGSTIVDFYTALVAEDVEQAREGKISEDVAFAEGQDWLRDAVRDIKREEVPPGLNEDSAAEQAIRDLLTVAHDDAMLGGSEWMFEYVQPTVFELLGGMYERAQKRCATNHDLSQVPWIVHVDGEEQLLGSVGHPFDEDLKCLRFRVEIDSQVNYDASAADPSNSGGFSWHYQATVPLKSDPATGYQVVDGSAPGTFTTASGSYTTTSGTYCEGSSGDSTFTETLTAGDGGTVNVARLSYSISGQEVSNFNLLLSSSAIEDYHVVETGHCSSDTTQQLPLWWSDVSLTAVAWGYAADGGNGLISIPFDAGSGEVIAQKTLPASDGMAYSGFTTIQVIHTPGA